MISASDFSIFKFFLYIEKCEAGLTLNFNVIYFEKQL